ncbi:MAG: carboxypeptidase regulatory-like domain-containing protein [Gemmatimonadales bacterium]
MLLPPLLACRFRWRGWSWLILASATPGILASQTVIVRVTDAETKRPVAGAIVRLTDTTARAVAQGLTTESGRLVLRAPRPGQYLLRADRIGHGGVWTEPFAVGDSVSVAIAMPADPVFLADLTVTGATSCEPRADGAETAALWTEVQKALTAEALTAASQTTELAVRRFRQHRTLAGGLQFDSTESLYRTTVSPFVSPAPSELARRGYINSARGGFQFHGPDALTLLSPQFLATHCYSVARSPNDSALVGLGFVPTPEVKRPDVRGVLWVDRSSNELRSLEFEYVNAPKPVEAPGIGGRVEFERLTTGAWIIRDWYIRAPRRFARVLRFGRDTLVGYLDQGGSVRHVSDPSLALGEATARVAAGARVFGDILGRVVDTEGRPVVGAAVATTVGDSVHTTDQEGRFEVKDVAVGRLGVRLRAIGFRPLNLALTVSAQRRVIDTTLVLARAAQVLDSLVVAGTADRPVAGKMIDVERRRQAGLGKFLTRTELQDPLWGGLDTQLRRFARVRLVPLCGGLGFAAAGPEFGGDGAVNIGCVTACFMTVFLDGVPLWSPDMAGLASPPDLSQFHPQNLEAVEVYSTRAVVPIEFTGRLSPCGVILVWTAVGGRR